MHLPRWKTISQKIGPEPSREGMTDVEYYVSDDHKNFRRKFTKTEEFIKEYEEKIADSLTALRIIGNSYTASVWLGVASHLETRRDDLTGKRLGIGSYGSGSSAKEVAKGIKLMKNLAERQRIPMDVYEDLHEGRRQLNESVIPPKNEFALVNLGTQSHDHGYRYYRYIK